MFILDFERGNSNIIHFDFIIEAAKKGLPLIQNQKQHEGGNAYLNTPNVYDTALGFLSAENRFRFVCVPNNKTLVNKI